MAESSITNFIHKNHCDFDADVIINNRRPEIIPLSGPPITLPVNFVIVQDLNGNNNYSLDNQNHANFLNDIADKMNARMDNLGPEDCSCNDQPSYYIDSRITYDVSFIEMRSEIWDHNVNDTNPIGYGGTDLRCPIGDHYVGQLNDEFKLHPDYSEGISFFFTNGLEGAAQYNGWWYSGFRCDSDLDHPALIHVPSSFSNYNFIVNNTGNPALPHLVTLDQESNFEARSAAHEIFHQFQIGVGHKPCCKINLMNPNSICENADPQDPATALTGCQLREAYGTMMASHMAKFIPCLQSYDQEIEITEINTSRENCSYKINYLMNQG